MGALYFLNKWKSDTQKYIDEGLSVTDAQWKAKRSFKSDMNNIKNATIREAKKIVEREKQLEKRENGHNEEVIDIDNEKAYLLDQLTKAINEKNEKLQKWVEKRMEDLGIKENKNIETEKTPGGNMLDKYAGTIISIMFISTVFSFFRK